MSGIKTINGILPTVKRPYRLQDLQDAWQGMNTALASGTTDKPRVISGFEQIGTTHWSTGVIAFNGQLYAYSDTQPIAIGATIYAKRVPSGDLRIFADLTEQTFSFDNIITTDANGSTLIGVASIDNVYTWRSSYIEAGTFFGQYKLVTGILNVGVGANIDKLVFTPSAHVRDNETFVIKRETFIGSEQDSKLASSYSFTCNGKLPLAGSITSVLDFMSGWDLFRTGNIPVLGSNFNPLYPPLLVFFPLGIPDQSYAGMLRFNISCLFPL